MALSQLVFSLWFISYEVSAVEVAVLLEESMIFGQLVGEMVRWQVESLRFINLKASYIYCFGKIGGSFIETGFQTKCYLWRVGMESRAAAKSCTLRTLCCAGSVNKSCDPHGRC